MADRALVRRLGRGPSLGAVATKIVTADETSEMESATILGQFVEVPDDFAKSL